MAARIIADSSCDLYELEGADYAYVPMKINAGDKEYVDTPALDTAHMVEELMAFKGRSRTSCPNFHEWLTAFGDSEEVFGVTITSNLSGCNSAANHAKTEYLEKHPNRKALIIDSLSTGPEMVLIIEKLQEMIAQGNPFEKIKEAIAAYQKKTHLLFCLENMHNLAQNGRVSPLAAKAAGLLGIRVVGEASPEGTLGLLHKCRGQKKAILTMVEEMVKNHYNGGKVRIAHCLNLQAAEELKAAILSRFPQAEVIIRKSRALCSFYAEKGGLLLGYEG